MPYNPHAPNDNIPNNEPLPPEPPVENDPNWMDTGVEFDGNSFWREYWGGIDGEQIRTVDIDPPYIDKSTREIDELIIAIESYINEQIDCFELALDALKLWVARGYDVLERKERAYMLTLLQSVKKAQDLIASLLAEFERRRLLSLTISNPQVLGQGYLEYNPTQKDQFGNWSDAWEALNAGRHIIIDKNGLIVDIWDMSTGNIYNALGAKIGNRKVAWNSQDPTNGYDR